MSNLGGGGYHWQTKEHADTWDVRQKARAPEREEAFRALLGQLPPDEGAPLRILDIGAGDGKVASVVLERYPNSTATLVDFSKPMMEKGAEKLARFGDRFRYHFWDMNEGEWPAALDRPFDAVVSSAAIHHLVNDRKAWLASRVHERLVPGGVFANYDLFREPDAVFPEENIHDRTCATVDEAKGFLMSAGFSDILLFHRADRPGRQTEVALLVGRKGVAK